MTRLGLVGTGFIVREALRVLAGHPDLKVSRILTRRPIDSVDGLDRTRLTHNVDELIDACDIVFEATGDPIHATDVVERALRAGRKVVTMNSELHVSTGSYLADLGYLTEADGDQPGALALLRKETLAMGFEPIAYVNIKGFLNHNPTRAEMEFWSTRQGMSLAETTSFTDGTKLNIEQALVANAFDATLAYDGMMGGTVESIYHTDHLVKAAATVGQPISDYVQCASAPPGVFILAESGAREVLPHYGPYEKLRTKGDSAYVLLRPFHLCGMEVAKSIRGVLDGEPPLLNNGRVPRVSVAALAKHELRSGSVIRRPIGSFDVRGEAILSAEYPDHVPLCLLEGARLKHAIEPGQRIEFGDVELPPSRAVQIWRQILRPRFAPAVKLHGPTKIVPAATTSPVTSRAI